jgi:hypothetical protein
MASVFRTTATWQGFIGAPGYTKLSFIEVVGTAGADAVTLATRTFLNAFALEIPSGTTITVAREVGEYDEVTGQLIGELSASVTPTAITGGTSSPYAGGSGFFVGWRTASIWQGNRVQGRTFIVPAVGVNESNGTLTSALIATAQSAGDALIADPNTVFAIWAKRFAVGADGKPHQSNGAAFQATSAFVRDRASGLRSRRD